MTKTKSEKELKGCQVGGAEELNVKLEGGEMSGRKKRVDIGGKVVMGDECTK